MPAPSGKIKLSGALSAPAKAPHPAGSRKTNATSIPPASTKSRRWKPFARFVTGPRTNPTAEKDSSPSKLRPASGKTTEKATASGKRSAHRSSLLPGGVWLWCLVGLAIGLGVWLGGRAYLRTQLVEQLSSAQSEAVALQSIDALLRLDADATIDVSRGLGHPEFMVANAAYRALTSQLDAWRKLSASEQLRRMRQVIDALGQVPTDLDQDHRILLAGLASRIYAEALSNREAGTADLLADCKRIMAMSEPRIVSDTTTMASVSNTPSARVASNAASRPSGSWEVTGGVTGSLRDNSLNDDEPSSPVPPPLPAAIPPNRQIIQKTISDEDSPEELDEPSASIPSLDSSSASRAAGMPRLTSLTQEETTSGSSRANLQLTSSATSIGDSARRKTQSALSQAALSQAALSQAARDEQAAEATISGMEELPIEQLVRLLASVQPRVSQAAALVLRQRGMTDANLELAIQLATGSTEQRRELLQSIAARDDLDPRPWLLWMAADGETLVRQQSIGLLANLLDNDVRRRLRMLLNKENDEQVASTIRRVLSK